MNTPGAKFNGIDYPMPPKMDFALLSRTPSFIGFLVFNFFLCWVVVVVMVIQREGQEKSLDPLLSPFPLLSFEDSI